MNQQSKKAVKKKLGQKKLKENFDERFLSSLEAVTGGNIRSYAPSLKVRAYLGGKKKIDVSLGDEYLYYDIASLTKVVFTTSALMWAYDQKLFRLEDKLSNYLDWWPHHDLNVAEVLSHSAGLPWWKPFFRRLPRDLKNSIDWKIKRDWLQEKMASTILASSKKAIYSDLDFILLGFFLESIYQKDLLGVWQDQARRLKMRKTHFSKNNTPVYKKSNYAPTEKSLWRKRWLQGEVHDDNTWALGGISSHAGLFSNMEEVSDWALMLRKARLKGFQPLASKKTTQLFTSRFIAKTKGDWGLGFMLPSSSGASCGSYFSKKSFGHTGFTGTSIWMDPEQDLLVVILSNRVCPSRRRKKFVKLRPQIHDIIYQLLIN